MTEPAKRSRASKLEWVRIGDMRVSPKAQRELRKAHVERIAAEFDLEAIGFPVISHRDGHYWLLDGQHRIAALKLNGFTDDDLIQCEVYEGLSETDDAELFLQRDARKQINKFDKFTISITAGRQQACHIERIVHAEGFTISRKRSSGSITAVAALEFAYSQGSDTLARSLRILGNAFRDDPSAFDQELIKGMALVCQRYDGKLDEDEAREKLGSLAGGTGAIKRKANALQLKTGHTAPHCTAAAFVDVINSRRGGKKLESWWA